jgi:hypothetical protein
MSGPDQWVCEKHKTSGFMPDELGLGDGCPGCLEERIRERERADLMDEVVGWAVCWWASKCPAEMTAAEHAKNPTVNTVGDREERLAYVVASYLQLPGVPKSHGFRSKIRERAINECYFAKERGCPNPDNDDYRIGYAAGIEHKCAAIRKLSSARPVWIGVRP